MTDKPNDPSRQDVWKMFDRIAPRYDLLNRVLSLRRDVAWRRRMARHLPAKRPIDILDLATGTGDQLLYMVDHLKGVRKAVGIDLAEKMLEIGRQKIEKRGLTGKVTLQSGDALAIPFEDESFDAVTMSFGIRNVVSVDKCLQEMLRVLRPGGRALVLECTVPSVPFLKKLYLGYFRNVLPKLGAAISGDASAYRYLNETVETFPARDEFCDLMKRNGFTMAGHISFTLGVACLYVGHKKAAA